MHYCTQEAKFRTKQKNIWCKGRLAAPNNWFFWLKTVGGGSAQKWTEKCYKHTTFSTRLQCITSQHCINCFKSRSKLKRYVRKWFIRGWEMQKFLHFKWSCLRGSFSWTMLESEVVIAQKWPEIMKVTCWHEFACLTAL